MTFDEIAVDVVVSLGAYLQSSIQRLPTHFENTVSLPEADYIRVRIDGPDIKEPSKNAYHVVLEVDLLITRYKTNNILNLRQDVGECMEVLRKPIPVFHNSVKLGCFTNMDFKGRAHAIDTHHYIKHEDPGLSLATVSTKLFILL